MGKRSSFERVPRDFYPTPYEAVVPLLPHLAPRTLFAEPCAGDGALVDALQAAGHLCCAATDIEPRRADILEADALRGPWAGFDCLITNPPWSRDVLHPMIEHFSSFAPTVLLFDADWVHTKQAMPFRSRLRKIVSVGRVRWIPGTKMTGKDNVAWHFFDKPDPNLPTHFHMREPAQFIGRAA